MSIQWSDWASLGKPEGIDLSRPFVQHNQDGRLEVFATSQGAIFNIWQVAPNSGWADGWHRKGIPQVNVIQLVAHLVGRNADGRQEIFALGDNGVLFQKWQVAPNDGWSDWKSMGTPAAGLIFTGQFTVGRNQDGRQEIFAEASDGNVWRIWQTAPNGGWSGWKQTGQPPAGMRPADRISVGSNLDGGQELFVMGGDDALWHIWQVAPNIGWSDWASLGKPRDTTFPEPKDRDLSQPVVQKNADGHLEVFSPGNGAFCNR